MIGIFTGARIKELDRYTIEHEPVSSIDLVERAAATWVYEFERLYTQQRRIIVFAGPGNNGADALCAARILGENGYSVDAFLFNVSGSLSPECNECRVRLLETSGIRLTEVVDNFIPPELSSQTVVVDGLFGVGLNRPLQGGFAKVVEFLNQSGAEIVSIDIPSGLFEEDNFGNNPNAIIRATHTLTFEYPKLSFLFSENADYVGKWKVLNIGLSVEGKQTIKTEYFLNTDFDISGIIRQRPRFAHKGTFGHALLIAGSRGKMGAACLAAKACLRSGIGLLTTHIPACG
ncbi:NAD(P)H-hydrate epimerase, partial [Porphyromonas gingivalis]